MARPAKSVKTKSGVIPKAEENARRAAEDGIRGGDSRLIPPEWLTEAQKAIFTYIRDTLKESGILGDLDIYILTHTAVTIDCLRTLEKKTNGNPKLLLDTGAAQSREKYTRDFFRCCNELCLSPQSRAKIAINAANNVREDKKSLLDILNEDDGEE